MPRMIVNLDSINNVIILEDLGAISDYTVLYQLEQKIDKAELKQLVDL
jgi:hypothetical protein